MGAHRWLTVSSPSGREDHQLLLEPNVNPAAAAYQQSLRQQGIPATSFQSSNVAADYARLRALGVVFTTPPTPSGITTLATFEDTCGNLIQIHERPGSPRNDPPAPLRIQLSSIFVKNQEHAARWYTEALGFVVKTDVPVGDFRWLTLVSPEDPDGMELVLEPNANPAAATFQQALFDQGIPATSFRTPNITATCDQLQAHGMVLRSPPTLFGTTTLATFEDSCGNLIQLFQP
jgi:predicted enzyme related to lactoylglutathione lyase